MKKRIVALMLALIMIIEPVNMAGATEFTSQEEYQENIFSDAEDETLFSDGESDSSFMDGNIQEEAQDAESEYVDIGNQRLFFDIVSETEEAQPIKVSINEIRDNRDKNDEIAGMFFIPDAFSINDEQYEVIQLQSTLFEESQVVKNIFIPDTVQNIDDTAFGNNNSLTIFCNTGSYCETFALEHGLAVVTDCISIEAPDSELSLGSQTKINIKKNMDWIPNNEKVEWSVSDATVAEIDNEGVLSALKVGNVEVCANLGGVNASCKIQVFEANKVLGEIKEINLDGEITYQNQGQISDFILEDGVIKGYNGSGGVVEIPSEIDGVTVTAIGEGAFSGNTAITGVTFPKGINSIGAKAFSNCTELGGILSIPQGVVNIERQAFAHCYKISHLDLPEGLEKIGEEAFDSNRGIAGELIIPDTVIEIGSYAFCGCTGVTGLKLGSGLLRIGNGAFQSCGANGEVIIPEGIEKIESNTFQFMSNVVCFVIGSNVRDLGYQAFDDCRRVKKLVFLGSIPPDNPGNLYSMYSLESVHVPSGTYSVYSEQFNHYLPSGARIIEEGSNGCQIKNNVLILYSGEETEVVVPDNVKAIGKGAFQNNQTLRRVILPETLEEIQKYAFSGCTALTEVRLPKFLEEIHEYAFNGCTGLTEVELPGGLKVIERDAFHGCVELGGTLSIPEGVTSIGDRAFLECQKLSGLELSEGLVAIGNNAFQANSGITGELVIPDTVTEVGGYAFSDCSGLTGLKLGTGLQKIGSGAFQACGGVIGEVIIPEGIENIESYAFQYMSKAERFVIGSRVKDLGYQAFNGCSGIKELEFLVNIPPASPVNLAYMYSLERVYVPSGTYGAYSEQFKSSLPSGARLIEVGSSGCQVQDGVLVMYAGEETEVTVPDGVKVIGEGAFQNNKSVERVVLPEGLEEIRAYAFSGCTALAEVSLPEGLKVIEPYAFHECRELGGILIIPKGVTSIGEGAFSSCQKLSGLELPNGLLKIGNSAFGSDSGIVGELIIPDTVTEIGSYAFSGCSGLTGLRLGAGLQKIGGGAFQSCGGVLGEIVIPEGIENIESYTFQYMSKAERFVIGSRVKDLGYQAFNGCSGIKELEFLVNTPPASPVNLAYMYSLERVYVPSGTYGAYSEQFKSSLPSGARLIEVGSSGCQVQDGVLVMYAGEETEVTVPDGVKVIGEGAFQNNKTVTRVVLPDSLEVIRAYAFSGCTALAEVSLPKGLKEVESYAFYECRELGGTLIIPEGVASIGEGAFSSCQKLSGLELPNGLLKIGNSAFGFDNGLAGELIIPDTVTEIGSYAFSGCSGLTGLRLGAGLQKIGGGAFQSCSGVLGEIIIPEGIENIESYTFQYMSKVERFVIGSRVKDLGYQAFNGCSGIKELEFLVNTPPASPVNLAYMYSLEWVHVPSGTYGAYSEQFKSSLPSGARLIEIGSSGCQVKDGVLVMYAGEETEVTVPDGVKVIGEGAFQNNKSVTRVVLPEGIQEIRAYAFSGCTALEWVSMPEGLKEVGPYAFHECRELRNTLIIPEGMTSIGEGAFSSCQKLSGLELPNSLLKIGNNAFEFDSGLTGELIIPDTATEIGSYAFSGCTGLTGLRLGTGLQWIGGGAFQFCEGVSGEITIPEGIENIQNYTFQSMSKAERFVIGSRVKDLGYMAFNGCGEVKELEFLGNTPPASAVNLTYMYNIERVYVPSGTYGAYSEQFRSNLPSGARLIEQGNSGCLVRDGVLLMYGGEESEVIVPEGVKVIGEGAFQNNKTVTRITLPEGVEKIRKGAFSGCTSLASINLPESLRDIQEYAFHGCSELMQVIVPEGVEEIRSHTFSECRCLSELHLPESLKRIGEFAFCNCSDLSGKLVIPSNVTEIEDYAFIYCFNLNSLELPEGLERVGDAAFDNCLGLAGELKIPDSVSAIGSCAFKNCESLSGLKLGAGLRSIGSRAFYDCSSVKGEVVLPEGLETVGDGSFHNMKRMETLTVGSKVRNLGSDGFYGCTGVKAVVFLGSVPPEYNLNNLNYMTGLEKVYVPKESYETYRTAFATYLPNNAVIITDSLLFAPGNFKVDRVYSHTAYLSWNPAQSNEVIGYKLYRDDEVEPLAVLTATSFIDKNLTVDKRYSYKVAGYTEDGRMTAFSATALTPKEPSVLRLDTGNLQNKINLTKNYLYAYAGNTGNLDSLGDLQTTGTFYYLDADNKRIKIGDSLKNYSTTSTGEARYQTRWDISDIKDGTYQVIFVLTDADGVSAEKQMQVTVDTSRPQKIRSVVALGDTNQIVLTWAMAIESDVDQYRIYRKAESDTDFYILAYINSRNQLDYVDNKVRGDQKYDYYVVAVDSNGMESLPSEIVSAYPGIDVEKPRILELNPSPERRISGKVKFSLRAEDNVSVTKTELYTSTDDGVNWILLSSGTSSSVDGTFDTTEILSGKLKVKGLAYDARNNISDPLIYTYEVDNQGPEAVSGVNAESTAVSITLRWNDVSDQDIAFYRVEQKQKDGTYLKVSDSYKTLGINLTGLKPDTEYIYRVVGYDLLGNRGIPSGDCIVKTQKDEVPPVITALNPKPGRYNANISFKVTAEDAYGIARVKIQASTNLSEWKYIQERSYDSIHTAVTESFLVPLEGYSEGSLYLRAVAYDHSGNISDTSLYAPYVEYIVDRTPPAAPENFQVNGKNGYIELSWTQGAESDLDGYNIYRKEGHGGNFAKVTSRLHQKNYIDRTCTAGVEYFYAISAVDEAGNESVWSEEVSSSVLDDTENPEIVSVSPAEGERLGDSFKTVRILASDNQALHSIHVQYRKKDEPEYAELPSEQNVDSHYVTADFVIPIEKYKDGDQIEIIAWATDKAGNESSRTKTAYLIDKQAPIVESVSVEYQDDEVKINWTGAAEHDILGYRVYRMIGHNDFQLIAQRKGSKDLKEYSWIDRTLPLGKCDCQYKVEAVDDVGNTSFKVSTVISIPDRSRPTPVLNCDSVMETEVEYVFDATQSKDNTGISSYKLDYGDGTSDTAGNGRFVHKFGTVGTYTVTLTIWDEDGNEALLQKDITVREPGLFGTAVIKVVDTAGAPLTHAPVYFDLGEEEQVIRETDNSGTARFTAEVGKHAVGCVIGNNQYLPAKKEIILKNGVEISLTIVMTKSPIIDGTFEIHRMTFDEIIAAGIDVKKPENQYIAKVEVKLQYGTEQVDTSFEYNYSTGTVISKPIIVDTTEGQREIIPVVIAPQIPVGNEDGYHFEKDVAVAYLDVPIGTSILKEFFDVRLYIMNHASSEFSMLSNQIQLNVPEGLSIVEAQGHEESSQVYLQEIPGQTMKTLQWVLRGDKVGSYELSADYSGILSKFNAPMTARFESSEKIEVYGMTGLKMTIEIPRELDFGTLYYNAILENTGLLDVYLPNIKTDDLLIESEYYDTIGNMVTVDPLVDVNALKEGNGKEHITTISEYPKTLKIGEKIANHYMCLSQTNYSEKIKELEKYFVEAMNEYGLEIKVEKRDLKYFKDYLDAKDFSVDKFLALSQKNQSYFEYLMDDINYIYWDIYQANGGVELPSNAEEDFWNIFKILSGGGDLKEIFGAEDEEQIKALLLSAMEIQVEEGHMPGMETTVKFLKECKKYAEKFKVDAGGEILFEKIGNTIPQTFNLIYTKYEYTAYKILMEQSFAKFEDFIVSVASTTIEYQNITAVSAETKENALRKTIKQFFSADGFKDVWKSLGFNLKAAQTIVDAYKAIDMDASIFIQSRATQQECELFLDAVICNLDTNGEAGLVRKSAKKLKEIISSDEYNPLLTLENFGWDEMKYTLLNKGKEVLLSKLWGTPSSIAKGIKAVMKITVAVGDNVFHLSERHDIADNIRFLVHIGDALKAQINKRKTDYETYKIDEYATESMQLIGYLLTIRRIGESQMAQFGQTFEVLQGVFDSKEMLYNVNRLLGTESTSWIEWLDIVQDKIQIARLHLLQNPNAETPNAYTGPAVNINYKKGQTMQSFDSGYEYAINDKNVWYPCNGGPITFEPKFFSQWLWVKKKNVQEGDSERLTTLRSIAAIPEFVYGTIKVYKTKTGYRIINLDNITQYECTFSKEPLKLGYDTVLPYAIPRESYTYDFDTDENFDYVYIRTQANQEAFASRIGQIKIHDMVEVSTVLDGNGKVTGGGTYEKGETVTLKAESDAGWKFAGWYAGENLISSEAEYSFTAETDVEYTARFEDKRLQGISLNQEEVTLTVGESITLEVRYSPEDTLDDRSVKWSSSDESVAEVTEGAVTAKAKGEAQITAEVGEYSATCRIKVEVPKVTIGAVVSEGGTVSGGGTYEKGETVTLKAESDAGWKFVGWYQGENLMSAEVEYSFTAESDVEYMARFEDKRLQDITLTQEEVTLTAGESITLEVRYNPEDTLDDRSVKWSSSDESVAEVTEGAVTARAKGEAQITAEVGEYSATCRIKVEAPKVTIGAVVSEGGTVSGGGIYEKGESVTLKAESDAGWKFSGWYVGESLMSSEAEYSFTAESDVEYMARFEDKRLQEISLNQEEVALTVGESITLEVRYSPEDTLDDRSVKWSSSDESVAGVTEGVVTAKAKGEAQITAEVGEYSATCRIKVEVPKVTIGAVASEGGKVSGGGTYERGESVTLKAESDAGWKFMGWYVGEALLSPEAGYSFTAETDVEYTAKFEDKRLQGVSFTQEKVTLTVGESVTLEIRYSPEDTLDDRSVKWSSSDESVAEVIEGAVTAKAKGEVQITAEVGQYSATCRIKVEAPKVTIGAIMSEGGTVTGGGTYEKGELVTLKAESDAGWKFAGWYVGESLMSSEAEYSFTAETDVEYTARFEDKRLQDITLTQEEVTLTAGESITLEVRYNPEDTLDDRSVKWSSSDESVAGVTEGAVTAKAKGEAQITAKVGQYSATCRIKVEALRVNIGAIVSEGGKVSGGGTYEKGESVTLKAESDAGWKFSGWYQGENLMSAEAEYSFTAESDVEYTARFEDKRLQGISLNQEEVTLTAGEGIALEVSYSPEDTLDDRGVKWSSSNESIAEVTEGAVTAKAKGEAQITAEVGQYSATCRIKVEAPKVTIGAIVSEGGTVIGGGTYEKGETVTLKAESDAGWKFAGWYAGENLMSSEAEYSFTAETDVEYTARFEDKRLQGISFSQEEVTLTVEEGITLEVRYSPEDTLDDRSVKWSSSDESVAEVTEGAVTAKAKGEAQITAKVGQYSATCRIKVEAPKVTIGAIISEGGTVSGGGTYEKGETVTLKAESDAGWKFAGWYAGENLMSSEAEYSFTAETDLEYTARFEDKRLQGISLNQEEVTLTVGESIALEVRYSPEDTLDDRSVKWSSSNVLIAEVVEGTVIAKAPGEAIIQVKSGEFSAECKVNVKVGKVSIYASASIGGKISPTGTKEFKIGDDATYIVVSDSGYRLDYIKVDGVLVSNTLTYTFKNLSEDHSIEVVFIRANDSGGSTEEPNPPIIRPDGIIILPDGTILLPDGTEFKPDDNGNKPSIDADGNITASNGDVHMVDGTVIKSDGTTYNTDGSIIAANKDVIRPATVVMEEIQKKNNAAVVSISDECRGASGFDYVIGTDEDCIINKNYFKVNKNVLLSQTEFRYLPKGTYYAYCHSWVRGNDGKKVFGKWSECQMFEITVNTPQTPKVLKATVNNKNKRVSIKLNIPGAKGYDLVLGKKKAKVYGEIRPIDYGKNVKKNQTKKTVTFNNLKKGTYYLALHSYNRDDDGKKIFGPWSNVIKIVVK
ncbi:leucine-rich repeat protein [Blautia schinkii]|nr:leucine-rich repeat protein [Blautia schinkii]